MKKRLISIFLAAVMLLSLSACGSSELIRRLDAIDDRLDMLEDRLENGFEKAVAPAAEKPAEKPAEVPSQDSFPVSEQDALKAALEHAGLKESDVQMLHIHLDRDDRHSEYEVDFRYDGFEYEYEVSAESGDVISFDKDK